MKLRSNNLAPFILCIILALTVLLAPCCKKSGTEQSTSIPEKAGETVEVESPESKKDTPKSDSGQNEEKNEAEEESGSETFDEWSEISRAAILAAKTNNPTLPELRVLTLKRHGDWARVDLEPVDRSTDAASVFLKKSGGKWVVFDMGTGIGPEAYPEAPHEIFE